MSRSTYLRYEVIRTFRNRRFLFFSLGFPLLLFLLIAGANSQVDRRHQLSPLLHDRDGGVGSDDRQISPRSRISAERQVGWTRQLRITPLRTSDYFRAKIVCGYVMALLTIIVLYLAGTALGVRLDAGQWATMTGLLLVGLVPFAVLGVAVGHLMKPDSLGPAVGGRHGAVRRCSAGRGARSRPAGLLSTS